jgi:hypothetical protein
MNKKLFLEMLKLQDGFNENTVAGWKSQSLDWGTTILTEAAECSESVNFKWWKSGDANWDNVEVETIDLHHFIMSILLEKYSAEYLEDFYNLVYENRNEDELEVEDFHQIVKLLSKRALDYDFERTEENMYLMIDSFFDLLFNFTSIEAVYDLHTAYITKNCLNKFRQDNGYKDGTYVKIWNGVEDNVIAWNLAKEVDSENKFDNLYNELEVYYNTEVK